VQALGQQLGSTASVVRWVGTEVAHQKIEIENFNNLLTHVVRNLTQLNPPRSNYHQRKRKVLCQSYETTNKPSSTISILLFAFSRQWLYRSA